MKTFTKLLPTLLPILTLVATALSGEMQTLISAHPAVAITLNSVYAILTHWLPSPATKPASGS